MTPDEFQAAAIAILRSAVGWQTRIAARLGKNRRTVTRWMSGEWSIPDDVVAQIEEMMGGIDSAAVWPRGEWLTGVDEAGRELIYHMQAPRFVARIVGTDEDGLPHPEEAPADVISGIVYVADGSDPGDELVLCEIDWIDRPSPGEVVQLLEAAADAWEAAQAWETEMEG